jgi:hypothetical protein
MTRILWLFVVALLAVDVTMLLQKRQIEGQFAERFQDLQRKSDAAILKSKYADEEEDLLNVTRAVPAAFPHLAGETAEGAVQFVLLASIDDCTNSIEDEVAKLNQIALDSASGNREVRGFFVNEDRPEMAQTFIANLSPSPAFPITVKNLLPQVPHATTPLVLVIRSRDGKILDAHKPIPQDLTKRDAFYSRWTAALGLS